VVSIIYQKAIQASSGSNKSTQAKQ